MAEQAIENEAPAESGGMMGKLVFAGIGVVLLVIGIVVGPMVMNMINPPETEAAAEGEEAAPKGDGPAFYTSLHPPMVINFKDSLGEPHFMQVTLEVMAGDQVTINAVREHTPVIRNALILLYSNVVYEEVTTREGKEKMLAEGLVEVQNILTQKTGEPGVKALYFTGLVIQ